MDPVDKQALAVLSEIGRISTSSAGLTDKLQRITEAVMRGMGMDGASIFLLDAPGTTVSLVAALGLNQETVGRLSFPLGKGIAGWVAEQKVPLALQDPYSDPRFQYVPESGIERFRSLAAAPILDGDRCLGVLFVLSARSWNATTSDVTLITTAANQISGVIKSTLLFESIQERVAELSTINETGLALTSTLDLGRLLELIAQRTAGALRSRGCAIRVVDLPASQGTQQSRYAAEAVRGLDGVLGDRVRARTTGERRPVLIADTAADPAFQDLAGTPSASILSVPLLYHDRVTGVVTLYDREDGQPFTEDAIPFLAALAGSAAAAVENAALFERLEHLAREAGERAQEFEILFDISTAMSATLNLDRLLRIILTAATMGGSGLGFNRAILLLVNERSHVLQGMMGVGPASWEEADRAWTEVARRHKGIMEWIQTGELFEPRDTEINAIARGLRIPLDPNEGVLARTVLEKRPFNIPDAAADPAVKRELREVLQADSFATVPLIAKDRVIGVVLVDNRFTRRPITEHDLRFLTMFARQAALAIDNAVAHSRMEAMNRDVRAMHEQLAQSEKMAALGAMMAEITHEFRNPLVSIGGFARRLARKVEEPDARRYLDIILREVTRLEGIIHDNLGYIKNAAPVLARGDLNGLIGEVLEVYEEELRQRGIAVERSLAPALPAVQMDAAQMKQAVGNVVANAMEAMEKGGVLIVRTAADEATGDVLVEVGDTGPGIPPERIPNLFNPYFTTKVRGTGLGLPITNRVITAHRGKVLFRNKETGGAVFTLRLPRSPDNP